MIANWAKKCFFFDETPLPGGEIRHIQGLGAEQIYFMSNPKREGEVGFANGISSFNRMLNTSLGRMRDDGDPDNLNSQMGYWAGIVQHRKGANTPVSRASDIPAATLTDDKLDDNEEKLMAYLNERNVERSDFENFKKRAGTPTPKSNGIPSAAASSVNESKNARIIKNPPSPPTPPIVESNKIAPVDKVYEVYNFDYKGERKTLKKGDKARTSYENFDRTIVRFEQGNDFTFVILRDSNGNEVKEKAANVKFYFNSAAFSGITKAFSDSKRLVALGEITLQSHKVVANKGLDSYQLHKLNEAKMKLYAHLEKNSKESLPLIGKVMDNGFVQGVGTTSNQANKTLVFEIDRTKIPQGIRDNIEDAGKDLAEDVKPLLYQIGVMPINQSPPSDLHEKGKINEWHAANNLKNAILNRLKATNGTLKASIQLGGNYWVTGIQRKKFGGKKKMIQDFIWELDEMQYRIIQDTVSEENRVGTFLYYTTIGELSNNPKEWKNDKRIGRVEVLPMPLEVTGDEMGYKDSVKRKAENYLNTILRDIKAAKKKPTVNTNAKWKSALGDFIRYNRLTISKHVLKDGVPSHQALSKMGLSSNLDEGEGVFVDSKNDYYSVLIGGMEVNVKAENKPDRYIWKSKGYTNPIKFVTYLLEQLEKGALNKHIGKVRFPTIIEDAQTGELETHPSGHPSLYENYLIPEELNITPPMPIVKATSVLELLDDADVRAKRQAAESTTSEMVAETEPKPNTEPQQENPPMEVTDEDIDDLMEMMENEEDEDYFDEDSYDDEEDENTPFIANEVVNDYEYEEYVFTNKFVKEEIFERGLGQLYSEKKVKLEMKPSFNGKRVYGAITKAGMVLDFIEKDGVAMIHKDTPAEEMFHEIVEGVISDKMYEKLYYEYAATQKDLYYYGGIASKNARERLAKEFNQWFLNELVDENNELKKRSKLSEFVKFFFDSLVYLINYVRGKNYKQQIYYKIWYGKYIKQVNRKIAAEMKGVEWEVKSIDYMNDWAIANEKLVKTDKVMEAFGGNMELINKLQNYIAGKIYNRPFFSALPTRSSLRTKENTFAKVVYNTKNRIANSAITMILRYNRGAIEVDKSKGKPEYQYMINGKPSGFHNIGAIKKNRLNHLVNMLGAIPVPGSFKTENGYEEKTLAKLTFDDAESLPDGRNSLKEAYFLMKLLENDKLYDATVQRIFNRVPVAEIMKGKFRGDETTYGAYVTDSIDNSGASSINISTRMSDVMRGMIEHTTLLVGRKNGSKVVWRNSYKEFDFAVAKDLLLRAALDAASPTKVSDVKAVAKFGEKGRPHTRLERMIHNIRKEIEKYEDGKIKEKETYPLEDSRSDHLKSLYQKFFDPKGLSYYAWANVIKNYEDYANALAYEINQGTQQKKMGSSNTLMAKEEFTIKNKQGKVVQDFDSYLKQKRRTSRKYINNIDVMFGGMKQAGLAGASLKRWRVMLEKAAGFERAPYPESVFRHYLSSKRLGGALNKQIAKQMMTTIMTIWTVWHIVKNLSMLGRKVYLWLGIENHIQSRW